MYACSGARLAPWPPVVTGREPAIRWWREPYGLESYPCRGAWLETDAPYLRWGWWGTRAAVSLVLSMIDGRRSIGSRTCRCRRGRDSHARVCSLGVWEHACGSRCGSMVVAAGCGVVTPACCAQVRTLGGWVCSVRARDLNLWCVLPCTRAALVGWRAAAAIAAARRWRRRLAR